MSKLYLQAPDGTRGTFRWGKDSIQIGRSTRSDVFLADQALSRRHAEIRLTGEGYVLRDLGSRNGTWLNGVRLRGEQPLCPSDIIGVGDHVLTFLPDDAAGAEPGLTEAWDEAALARRFCEGQTKPALEADELARRCRILNVLSEAAAALRSHHDLGRIYETVLELLFRALPADRGALVLFEGEPAQARINASWVRTGPALAEVDEAVARRVLTERTTFLLTGAPEGGSPEGGGGLAPSGIRSVACAPLWFTGGSPEQDAVIGFVYVDIVDFRQAFTEDDLRILTTLANLAAARIESVHLLVERLEKHRLDEEMRKAAEIQAGLLPSQIPEVPGYSLFAASRPGWAVGGDYYDFARAGQDLLLALGDVAGKGTGAAILMTLLRAAVRAHWREGRPSEAMARINRTLWKSVPEGRYATLFLARLDPHTGRLSYVNAGHHAPLLVRENGAVEALTEGGLVLGLFESATYTQAVVGLEPGDTLVVYSDGITEAGGGEGEEFGRQRLAEALLRGQRLDVGALVAGILAELERHAARAVDGRSLVVLRRDRECGVELPRRLHAGDAPLHVA